MQNLWSSVESERWNSNALEQRIYSARLLGLEPELGSQFGGSVSIKIAQKNIFGELDELIYVHRSQTDLTKLEVANFVPLRRKQLLKLLSLPEVSAWNLQQQIHLVSERPSPELPLNALLHAVIPSKYVDQVSPDAILSLTNTPRVFELIRSIFGPEVVLIPYFQSEFDLAKAVAHVFENRRSERPVALVLAKRGLCTFGDTAEESYRHMAQLVSAAEERVHQSLSPVRLGKTTLTVDSVVRTNVAQLRRKVSELTGRPMILASHPNEFLPELIARPDAAQLLSRGPATPEHLRYLKRPPLIGRDLQAFVQRYRGFFEQQQPIDFAELAPRIIIDPALGLLAVGDNPEEADLAAAVFRHMTKIILQAEQLGGWQPAPPSDLIGAESCGKTEHEKGSEFTGEIALVTGAASGIGRATVKTFLERGAAVAGLDLNPAISTLTNVPAFLGIPTDVTSERAINHALNRIVHRFGGLDILVVNTGYLPSARSIVDLELGAWQHAIRMNLDANFNLLRSCYPYLRESPRGGRVIVVAPQSLAPPGRGIAAYTAAKAALTELARSAAAEWGAARIRVQIIHPDGVFDTGIWTPEVLAQHAQSRSMTVEEYRRDNFLRTEITSRDVAELVIALCTPAFAKTTGAQIAIDGGCG
jgi:rhamnose utilization protein RhaD (predicted bifunctional aldolase and dehydrogenase)/NAD(P)-dependent dehydrogenase (short-subunit alcohol dehydrogenase family)